MSTFHPKKTAKEKQATDKDTAQRKSSQTPSFQFVDNRSEAKAQRRLQDMANNSPQLQQTAQLQQNISSEHNQSSTIQKKENKTGLPDNLKSGIENLSGYSMDDVKVHYNSSKPAQMQAHAYAQGTNIHIAPGQEKHLAHEAWHVIQQKQGRVKPTVQVNNLPVNDNPGLEREADVMGAKAIQMKKQTGQISQQQNKKTGAMGNQAPIQMDIGILRYHAQHQTMIYSNNRWYFIRGGTALAVGTPVEFDPEPRPLNAPPGIYWAGNVRAFLAGYRFNTAQNRLQSLTNFFGNTHPYSNHPPYRIDNGSIGRQGFGSIPVRWRLSGLDGAHAIGFNVHVYSNGRTGPGSLWISGINGAFNNEDIHVNWRNVIHYLLQIPAVAAQYQYLMQLFAQRKKQDDNKWASLKRNDNNDKDKGGDGSSGTGTGTATAK